MEATKILMEEHRVIEKVLSSLEASVARLEAGHSVRPGFFLDAADFIKEFADGCHHRKEEGVLFPAMESAGIPRHGGPIQVMLTEHEEGRRLTRAMREAAARLSAGDSHAENQVVSSARAYAALLRQHIAKEDGILFPMADHVIGVDQQADIAKEFERIEREETAGLHEKYLAVARALENEAK